MAGDIGVNERALVLPPGVEMTARAAGAEVTRNEGRVIHLYGPRVIIGEVSDEAAPAIAEAVAEAEIIGDPATLALETATADLDEIGSIGLRAFSLRLSPEYADAKANRPYQAEAWDRDEGTAPDHEAAGGSKGSAQSEAAIGTTSQRLTRSVAVGIIIVSGPGGLTFTSAEQNKVIAEVQNGLGWLGAQGTGVSWHYDIHFVTIPTQPDPHAPDLEALWRDPAMADLGYAANWAGVTQYIEDIQTRLQTDWTYVGFFTKYPVRHFAYASTGGPRLVMQYANDGWGPDNIDRVFAHETAHIFQAPDEYRDSGCNCGGAWGVYDVVNGNCETCAPNGGVDCIMRANSWSMCGFTPWHLGLDKPMLPMLAISGSREMGGGPDAVAWLIGDINGDGRSEIVQQWNNGGQLGTVVYGWSGNALTRIFSNDNMGEGSRAVAWLIGDINGDGRSEIVQPWNNGGRLGTLVYGWNGNALIRIFGSRDMGEGSRAVAWLIGDTNGDGRSEIIQEWDNGGRLGTVIYGWNGNALTRIFGSDDMGEGSRAAAWLIGDIDGDGRSEIIQEWDNGGRLGSLVYGWVHGGFTRIWGTSDVGEGSRAVAWLIGDVNGDGRAEVIHQWSNGGRLGSIVYGWKNSALTRLWGSRDMSQGSVAVGWLVGDVNGDGRDEVVQEWNNGGRLGTLVYGMPARQVNP